MSSLTSLTVLALIASTLLVVDARKKERPHQTLYLNKSYFEGENCHSKLDGTCESPDPCLCFPPFGTGFIRQEGYFYSPQHKACIRPTGGIGEGCNSFKDKTSCILKCARKYNPGKYKVKNMKS
uniref:Putative secreted protein n=1 Tax=Amblyomma cajennense TaxID=34607 RepID=A0A023FPX1_AMBCJ